MTTELERTLARELNAVADAIHVPAMSPVATTAPLRRAPWLPPLLAAAAVLLVAGALTVLLRQPGGSSATPPSWASSSASTPPASQEQTATSSSSPSSPVSTPPASQEQTATPPSSPSSPVSTSPASQEQATTPPSSLSSSPSTPPDPQAQTAPPVTFGPEQTLTDVVTKAGADERGALRDPNVIDDGEWTQLVRYAAGRPGTAEPCRDNGGGTMDCEIALDAHPGAAYYAILAPSDNAYGWQVTYLGLAHD
ncbi:hypothetical protein [Nocardioides plantarum]|uniref:Uncharacterized protein n=1 Tax=Nocardioides plantarum TaxID=29299 RepID=A0ABV5K7P9_9ACTN|nr:hypothetical protein [Nocardioides plantarum]